MRKVPSGEGMEEKTVFQGVPSGRVSAVASPEAGPNDS